MPGKARRLARSVRFNFSLRKIRSSVSFRPTVMSAVTGRAAANWVGAATAAVAVVAAAGTAPLAMGGSRSGLAGCSGGPDGSAVRWQAASRQAASSHAASLRGGNLIKDGLREKVIDYT